jgi:hypothetical protein
VRAACGAADPLNVGDYHVDFSSRSRTDVRGERDAVVGIPAGHELSAQAAASPSLSHEVPLDTNRETMSLLVAVAPAAVRSPHAARLARNRSRRLRDDERGGGGGRGRGNFGPALPAGSYLVKVTVDGKVVGTKTIVIETDSLQ